MNDKMIINARDKLSLGRRLLSDVVTALLWLGWITLWWPFARKFHEMMKLGIGFGPAAMDVMKTVSPVSLSHAVIALTGTSALLLLWTLLPSRQVEASHTEQSLTDYADHFGVDETEIEAGRAASICIVHHDDHGHIIDIEPVSASQPDQSDLTPDNPAIPR